MPKSVVAKPEEIWSYVTRTLTRFTGAPRSDLVGADEAIYTRLDKKITDHETTISDKIASHDSDIKNILGDPTVDNTKIYDFLKAQLDAKISSRSSHSPADVWSYSTRTLTQKGGLLKFEKYDELDLAADASYTPTAEGLYLAVVSPGMTYFTSDLCWEVYKTVAGERWCSLGTKNSAGEYAPFPLVISDGSNARFTNTSTSSRVVVFMRMS